MLPTSSEAGNPRFTDSSSRDSFSGSERRRNRSVPKKPPVDTDSPLPFNPNLLPLLLPYICNSAHSADVGNHGPSGFGALNGAGDESDCGDCYTTVLALCAAHPRMREIVERAHPSGYRAGHVRVNTRQYDPYHFAPAISGVAGRDDGHRARRRTTDTFGELSPLEGRSVPTNLAPAPGVSLLPLLTDRTQYYQAAMVLRRQGGRAQSALRSSRIVHDILDQNRREWLGMGLEQPPPITLRTVVITEESPALPCSRGTNLDEGRVPEALSQCLWWLQRQYRRDPTEQLQLVSHTLHGALPLCVLEEELPRLVSLRLNCWPVVSHRVVNTLPQQDMSAAVPLVDLPAFAGVYVDTLVPYAGGVEELNLCFLRMPPPNLRDLRPLAVFTRLRKLTLLASGRPMSNGLADSDIAWVAQLPSLEVVHVENMPELRDLSPLCELPKLRSLTLASLPRLHELEWVSRCASLEEISICLCRNLGPLEPLLAPSLLTVLRVHDCESVAGLRLPAEGGIPSQLRVLSLRATMLDTPPEGLTVRPLLLDEAAGASSGNATTAVAGCAPPSELRVLALTLSFMSLPCARAIATHVGLLECSIELTRLARVVPNAADMLEPLSVLSELRTLHLKRLPLVDLRFLRGCCRLEEVAVTHCEQLLNTHVLGSCSRHLRELSLLGSAPATDLDFVREQRVARELRPCYFADSLQELNLFSCPALQSLEPLAVLTRLRRLLVSDVDCDNVAWLAAAKFRPSLEELHLTNFSYLSDARGVAEMPALRVLALERSRITDVRWAASLLALEQLRLSGSHYLEDLSPLGSLTRLRILDASLSGVVRIAAPGWRRAAFLGSSLINWLLGPFGSHATPLWPLARPATLAGCRSLESVDLRCCPRLEDVSALATLPKLRTLDVSHCTLLMEPLWADTCLLESSADSDATRPFPLLQVLVCHSGHRCQADTDTWISRYLYLSEQQRQMVHTRCTTLRWLNGIHLVAHST